MNPNTGELIPIEPGEELIYSKAVQGFVPVPRRLQALARRRMESGQPADLKKGKLARFAAQVRAARAAKKRQEKKDKQKRRTAKASRKKNRV